MPTGFSSEKIKCHANVSSYKMIDRLALKRSASFLDDAVELLSREQNTGSIDGIGAIINQLEEISSFLEQAHADCVVTRLYDPDAILSEVSKLKETLSKMNEAKISPRSDWELEEIELSLDRVIEDIPHAAKISDDAVDEVLFLLSQKAPCCLVKLVNRAVNTQFDDWNVDHSSVTPYDFRYHAEQLISGLDKISSEETHDEWKLSVVYPLIREHFPEFADFDDIVLSKRPEDYVTFENGVSELNTELVEQERFAIYYHAVLENPHGRLIDEVWDYLSCGSKIPSSENEMLLALEDLNKLWDGLLDRVWEDAGIEEDAPPFGLDISWHPWQACWAAQKSREHPELAMLPNQAGLGSAVKAYFAGVPLEDILAT